MKRSEQREAEYLAKAGGGSLPAAKRAVRKFHDEYAWWGLAVVVTGIGGLVPIALAFFAYGSRYDPLVIPLVLLGVALNWGVVGLLGWRNRRVRALLAEEQRSPSALCTRCGYNLTGIDSIECPECGERIEQAASIPQR